jgi:hypothetical protein
MRSHVTTLGAALLLVWPALGAAQAEPTTALFEPQQAQRVDAKGKKSKSPCGVSPSDWCPAPPGDPCGRHHDAAACRADGKCFGMPYLGESVVACAVDERGFATNCPTVGCTSTPPRRQR